MRHLKSSKEDGARRRGIYKLAGGVLVYAAVWLYVFRQGGFGDSRGGTFYIIVRGAPGALALSGLLEIVTGRSFTGLAAHWDELAPWKRGVYGTTIVVAAATLIFGGLLLIGWLTHV